jgi:hypothetical protein
MHLTFLNISLILEKKMIDVYITTGFDDKVVTTIPNYELKEWLEDRERLCKAMGFETKLAPRMLHVVDNDKVHSVYFTRN